MGTTDIRRHTTTVGTWMWWVLCFVLPVSGSLVPLSMVLAVVLLLLGSEQRAWRLNFRILWPLAFFYVLHLVGMLWSTDQAFGLFDLQIKVGLVLLPIAGALVHARDGSALKRSMMAFSLGIAVAILLSVRSAVLCYAEFGWSECFTQSYLSFDLHPSYLAWYCVWALWFWCDRLLRAEVRTGLQRWLVGAFILVVIAFIVMLASKSGYIGLVIVLGWSFVRAVVLLHGKARRTVVLTAVLAMLIPGILLRSIIERRVLEAWQGFMHIAAPAPTTVEGEGSSERVIAWACSVQVLCDEPFGVGTGDVKHALVDCYAARGATHAVEKRLNSHNQFLQGGAALGWPGMLTMLALALVPFFTGKGNAGLRLFMVLFIINVAVESVLEVQAGVVFFALFLGLLAAGAQARSSAPQPTTDRP